MSAPLSSRFWAKVRKSEEGCWEWTAALNGAGYGVIGIGGRGEGIERAHRVSWILHYGPIGSGLFVCHRCDNRKCVRPGHLFLGTNEDNVADMWSKGRGSKPPAHRGIANARAHVIEHAGERKCLEEWASVTGIAAATIRHRIGAGWSVEQALYAPVRRWA